MRILVLGINHPPEQIGIAVYTGGLTQALAQAGHDVEVVAAVPYYPEWRVRAEFRGLHWRRTVEEGVTVTRCPLYVPAVPGGVKRILHHMSFAASALVPMLRAAAKRPQIVLVVAPSLIAAPVGLLAARLSGAQAWLHVQDFEVEAAFATGLLNDRGWSAHLAHGVERGIISAFDRVSTISAEMRQRLVLMGVAEGCTVELRNWTDVQRIRPLGAGKSPFRGEWGIETPHVALYSGNIANKQGIEIVVEAARRLAHVRDLTFVICGQGPNRETLERSAQGLTNILFRDLQPVDRLGDLLALASVHLLPQIAGAADLVLPSKLVNMLASGRPVVATAHPGTGLAREVEGCGIVVPPGDTAAFASAIERVIRDDVLIEQLGAGARARAESDWDRTAIIAKFLDVAQQSTRRT